MKKQNFLSKLKKEGKLGLVEPSEEIKLSYLQKAENCLKSAKILFQNKLYENSTSEAYYCMYNSLLALLFKIGIKSENHSASIILFDKLFNKKDLFKMISWAKKERIDKQYYVETQQTLKITQDLCKEIIDNAEDFHIKIKVILENLDNKAVFNTRKRFQDLTS